MQLIPYRHNDGFSFLPREMTSYSLMAYLVALALTSLLYYSQAMPFWLVLFGILSIMLFFIGGNYLTKRYGHIVEKDYIKHVFIIALLIRLCYAIFIYYFNWQHYGTYYESSVGDIEWYVPEALACASDWYAGQHHIQDMLTYGVDIGDIGYVLYLAVIYYITNSFSDVILPLIIKAILGAWTCILFYKLATRHFGESVGRMTGIFCALQANMIWWCGSMMKETEMVFLLSWFLNSMDQVLYVKSNPYQILLALIPGFLLAGFRTALFTICFGAVFVTLLFSQTYNLNWAKKIAMGLGLGVVLFLGTGHGVKNEVNKIQTIVEDRDYQKRDLDAKSNRKEGNRFAKYATATVMAPLIFTIPFPTMTQTYMRQEMHVMMHGGYFIKNVLSFFVILVMFLLLLSGEWRQHVFPIALLCGYLIALILSVFAHSGRYHLPVIPIELMFAAYGISLAQVTPKYKRWYIYALFFEIIACVVWNYFKLAGKGLA